jgi:hypothetical protein
MCLHYLIKIRGGKVKKNNQNFILILIVILIIGIPLLLLAFLISERNALCRLFIILIAGIYFSIIFGTLTWGYYVKRTSSNAPLITIEKLIGDFRKNKYGIITVKIKKVFPTQEEIRNKELLNSAKDVKRIGDVSKHFIFGATISNFRDYQISDGTKIIRIKGFPSYPKLEIGKEITILCELRKSGDQFYLRFIKNIEDECNNYVK